MWRAVIACPACVLFALALGHQVQLPAWCCHFLQLLPGTSRTHLLTGVYMSDVPSALVIRSLAVGTMLWILAQWMGGYKQLLSSTFKPAGQRRSQHHRASTMTSANGASCFSSTRTTKTSLEQPRVSFDLPKSGLSLLQLSTSGTAQTMGRLTVFSWPGAQAVSRQGSLAGLTADMMARITAMPDALSGLLSASGAAAGEYTRRSLQQPSASMCRRFSFYNNKTRAMVQAYSEVPEHNEQVLVLFVDPNPIDQAVVAMLLGSQPGFKVVGASTGKEALDVVFSATYLPDIVLLDVMLPDMSVTEVCRVLRSSFSPVELPIMLLTSRSGEADALAALERGVNDFLIKPLRHLELLARINSQMMVKQGVRREAESRAHYDLLVQVLPPHIIRRLAQGQAYIPEQHEQVTILFSDIVMFTELCSQWPTQQVVAMLDMMFSSFDDLCDKHGVFKVETIGDAYMCVCGHEGCLDHALRMAAMAVDMLSAVRGIQQQLGSNVQVRIGMHTGPALSGVVGKRRPRYCFFGDTVNTASRMESSGHAMTVHISDACKHSMLVAAAAVAAAVAAGAPPPTWCRTAAAAVTNSVDAASTVHLLSEFFLPTSPLDRQAADSDDASNRNSDSKGTGPAGMPGQHATWQPSSTSVPADAAAAAAAAGDQAISCAVQIKEAGSGDDGAAPAAPAAAAVAAAEAATASHPAEGAAADSSAGSGGGPSSSGLQRGSISLGSAGVGCGAVDGVLPWDLLDLGYQQVKGKGRMKTHLLKVGGWQAALQAVQARQAAEEGELHPCPEEPDTPHLTSSGAEAPQAPHDPSLTP